MSDLLKQLVRLRLPVTTDQMVSASVAELRRTGSRRRRYAAPRPALPAPGSALEGPPGAPAPSSACRCRRSSTHVRHGMRYNSAPVLLAFDCPAPGRRVQGACGVAARSSCADPGPGAHSPGFAPTRRTGWSSQTGFFLIWQSMTAQVNGFLPSQEPDLWCDDGNRSFRGSREELVARTRSGVLARVPLAAGHLAGDCSVLL
jgi:hypothetical protein